MTPSKIFFYFCLSFVGGIFLGSFFYFQQTALLLISIFGILLISVFYKYKELVLFGFCVLFLVLGIWRHQAAELRIADFAELRSSHALRFARANDLIKYNDSEQEITLIGRVVGEPDIREKIIRLTIKTDMSKVLLTTWRYPEYNYGDKLKITGKLESPPIFEDFNYRDHLKKDGIYSQMSWPEIELLQKGQGNFLYAKILQFKQRLRESLYQNSSPPQSSILGAIILGDKRQLAEDLKNKLNITGVRHITAISGLHVTVLSAILMSLLISLSFWRQQAFWFSIVLITLFIGMTGFQPSAVRAGIMGGLFLLAQYLGRLNISSRTIFFAAAVMLFHNPLLLRLDIGFQLSFLAMLGIIYLLPTFRDWLKFIPWENPKNILAMTFSAYLFTLPILIYNFGYISLVGPLVNLLVVPLLYLIMLFGFLFGLGGMIFQPLGWILSWPSWLMLTYLTTIVDWFSKLPLASLTFGKIHWIWLLISYAVLGYAAYKLKESQRLKFLRY